MPDSDKLPLPPAQSTAGDQLHLLDLDSFDQRLERYRLVQPKAEQLMLRSLRDYGQVSPVVVCQLDGSTVLVDGFKRLRAARSLKGTTCLRAQFLQVDEQGAKAAIFNLNRISTKPVELEEAWIIYALVQEDQVPQVEVAQMLGRHKSWVNRRLALIEKLSHEARAALRLGLLDCSAKMNTWLRFEGRGQLQACDRGPLLEGFSKLHQESQLLSEATADFIKELKLP